MAYRVRETPRYRAALVVVLCVVLSLVDVSDAGRGGFGGRSGGFGRGTGSKSSGSKSGGWSVFSSKPAAKPAPAPSPPKPAPRPNTANTALSYGPGYAAAKPAPSAPVGNAPQPAKPGWNVDQGASGANKPIGWNVNNQGSNPVPPPSHVSGVNSAAKPPPYSQYPQHAPPPQYTPHGGAPYPNQGAPPAYPGYGARPGQAQPPPYSYNPQYGHTSMSGGHPPAGYPQQQYRPGGGYYNNPSPGYHGGGYNPGGYGGGYSPGGYGGYGGGGGGFGGGFGAGSPFGYGGGGGYGMYEKKRSFFSSPVATVGTVFAGLALWELLRNRNQYKVYTVNHVYTDNRPNSFTQLANESKVEPGNTYIITPNNVACNVTEMKAESGSVFSLSCDTKEAFNATVVLPGNATAVIPCTATSAAGDAKLQASCNGNVNVNETQLTPVKYDVLNDTQVFTDIYNYCNATMMEMIVNNATLNATLNALLSSVNETENATASGNATSAAGNETSANETFAKLPCAPPPPNLLPPNPYPYPPPYGYPYPPPGYPYPPPPGYPNMSYPYPYPYPPPGYPYPPPPGYPNMTYPYPPPPGYPNMSYPYPPPPGFPEQVIASNQSADLSATQSSLSNAKVSPSRAESPHQSALIHAAVLAVSFAFARVLCT